MSVHPMSMPPPALAAGDYAGHAYGRAAPTSLHELTAVGRGTPMGELQRRYWQAVALASDATTTPRALRVLGEDLVLFRDLAGRAGLVVARCAHRGASLAYGRVDEAGLRCCYHGWAFDTQGRCTEMPCEPEGGVAIRQRVRQPWYPVQERYGLVWAYMGPLDRMPLLPCYAVLEELDAGELVEADDNNIGGGGPKVCDFNWFQHWENVIDPWHVVVLHGWFSGTQFVRDNTLVPERLDFALDDFGVRATSLRRTEDGRRFRRITGVALPNLRLVANPRSGAKSRRVESIGFVLAIDDTHFKVLTAARVREPGELAGYRSRQNGKLWEQLSDEEHRRYPGDYEAQKSQGAISAHSEEHLRSSDRGIALLRRLMKQQVDLVAAGGNPMGTIFDASRALVRHDHGVQVLDDDGDDNNDDNNNDDNNDGDRRR